MIADPITKDPFTIVALRIRFAGNIDSETIHMSNQEYDRLNADWSSYLSGNIVRGGEYMSQDGDHTVLISLNFDQIAYTEPGKIY